MTFTHAAHPGARIIHASAVLLGAEGVLLRGDPGCGKSTLGDALCDHWAQRGIYARHIADDQVHVWPLNARLIAAPPAALAGLWERAGTGIVPVPCQPRAVICLVCDLVEAGQMARMPENEAHQTRIAGIALPLLTVQARALAPAILQISTCLDARGAYSRGNPVVLAQGGPGGEAVDRQGME